MIYDMRYTNTSRVIYLYSIPHLSCLLVDLVSQVRCIESLEFILNYISYMDNLYNNTYMTNMMHTVIYTNNLYNTHTLFETYACSDYIYHFHKSRFIYELYIGLNVYVYNIHEQHWPVGTSCYLYKLSFFNICNSI